MPKIPGVTGGPAGATESMAGLRRKRTEQQHESEDEEDNEKTESQNPKAKKVCTVSNVKPSDSPRIDSSSSKAAVPLKVKAEPATSSVVPSQAPKPAPPDRMAALRRAKDAINQQQHFTLPTGPPSSFQQRKPLRQAKSSDAPFIRPTLIFPFFPSRTIQFQTYPQPELI